MADPNAFHGLDILQTAGTVLSIGLNIALLIVTGKAANAAQTSASAAQASAAAALRQAEITAAVEAPNVRIANVRIGGLGLTGPDGRPTIPEGPFLIVDLVNQGRTPADVVAFGFDKLVRTGPPAQVREADPCELASDVFDMPGGSTEVRYPFNLNGQERRRMRQGGDHLWLWGFIDHIDGLGVVRRHRFFVKTLLDANQEGTLFRFRSLRPPPVMR